jgi:hypothetical protein
VYEPTAPEPRKEHREFVFGRQTALKLSDAFGNGFRVRLRAELLERL